MRVCKFRRIGGGDIQTLRYINELGESLALGYTGDVILEHLDIGAAAVERRTSRGLGQDGVSEISKNIGTRIITASCCIVARGEEERFEVRRRVGRVLNPSIGGYMLYNNGFRDFRMDCGLNRAVEFGEMLANRRMQRFEAVFKCPMPFFTDVFETEGEFLEVTPRLGFPLRILESLVFSSLAGGRLNVDNKGDAAAPLKCTIFGPCLNPEVVNETSGEGMRLLFEIPEGQRIEITTHFANKRIDHIDGQGRRANIMQYLDMSRPAAFFSLRPGRNVLRFSADIGQDIGRMHIAFSPRYLIV